MILTIIEVLLKRINERQSPCGELGPGVLAAKPGAAWRAVLGAWRAPLLTSSPAVTLSLFSFSVTPSVWCPLFPSLLPSLLPTENTDEG